jgi:4-amino-4-deoxychorismate lyase
MLVNGKQCDLISIRDRGLLYGDGVFRTLRVSGALVPQWPLHYQKLQHDCTVLGIACPEFSLLTAELAGLIQTHPGGVVKLIVTRGPGVRGYAPPFDPRPTHIWDIAALPDYPADWESHGIRARLCKMRLGNQPRLAGIKHLNRLENVLAAAESNAADIAEGLLMDEDENVIGGTRSNLFLVSRGKLVTPDLSRCGVAGVQRDRVIAWAARHDIALQVRDVGLDEVLHADELFLVNSVIGIWPIRELEQQCWSAFPFAARIRDSFDRQES